MNDVCDKCGELVPPENNALSLDMILNAKSLGLVFMGARHLLPTENCPGSPSRAQYLEGQPRDTRPEYPYIEGAEPIVRAAYRELQLAVQRSSKANLN